MSVADEWAWAHREEQAAPPVGGFEHVTAILVVHNGETWLPSALRALADLDNRPGQLIVVDAGSTDASPQILREAMEKGIVARGMMVRDLISGIQTTSASGYSSVVNQLVASLHSPQRGWFWLLHDDAAPSRKCLTELMRVATSPNAGTGPAIVVPKLLRPKLRHRPDQVLSIGESVSVSGARVVAAEIPEAEQHDESAPVIGASTAGMLIRRDAWRELGGLSTELPGFRTGVDLGWRANELGLTVKTAPEATLRHQQAGLLGLRDGSTGSQVADAVAGLRVAVAHSRHPVVAAWRGRIVNRLLWVGAWLGKDDRQARHQSAMLARTRKEKAQTKALTKAVRSERKQPVAKFLLPGPFWGLKHLFDNIMQRVPATEDWGDGTINLDALTGDDDTVVLPAMPRRSLTGLGASLGIIVATLVACRHLLGFAPLVSSGLAAAPSNLAGAWAAWLEPATGQGANAPWLALMALGSTIAGGQPWLWASIMVLGGVGLAAWSAYRFVKVFVSTGWARVGLALLWAVVLPATGASADGSPGWVLLAVALPLVASSLMRWTREPTGRLIGLRAPAAVALGLVLAACVTPALWVAGALAAALVAARVRDWRGFVLVVLAPVIVLGPWLLRLWSEPGRVLTGVDPTLTRLMDAPAPWFVPLGQLGFQSSTPLPVGAVVLGGIWLVGLIGMARLSSALWRRLLLSGLAALLIASAVMSRIVVDIDGHAVRAASLPWLMVAAMLSIGVTAAGWHTAPPMRRRHHDSEESDRGSVGAATVQRIIAVLVGVAALVGAAWWLWDGQGAPMKRQGAIIPDYVTAAENSPRASRTLMVNIVGGQAGVSLHGASEPCWGAGEQSPLPVDPAARDAIVAIAGQFAEGFPSDDLADRLTALGIGHVIVMGADDQTTQALAGLPKLVSGDVNGVTVWTVGGLPSRASLVDGAVVTPLSEGKVPPGGAGRFITLVGRGDLPWQVSVGGQQLDAKGSATRFEAPAAGGDLRWSLPQMWWAVWWYLAALVLLVWAALPGSGGAKRATRWGARRAVS